MEKRSRLAGEKDWNVLSISPTRRSITFDYDRIHDQTASIRAIYRLLPFFGKAHVAYIPDGTPHENLRAQLRALEEISESKVEVTL